MKTIRYGTSLAIIVALALLIPPGNASAGSPPAAESKPQKLVHDWEYITFPATSPDGKGPVFMAGYGEENSGYKNGFSVDISNLPWALFKTNTITARLHRANGEIVEPTEEGKKCLNDPVGLSGGLPQVMTFFPWGKNVLEECWVEVSLGPERYWLEIPYGFDRDPRDPLPPPNAGGVPKTVPAMKSLTAHDHVLPWKNVQYDVGAIQNKRRLSLIQSNPVNTDYAESEVVLYRDDWAVGKSIYLWDLHAPRTTLRILNADESVVRGNAMDIRLHDDGLRRSDLFYLNRNMNGKRCWGQVEITVDDKSYRVLVPSSLYEYTHGHASLN